MPRGDGMGPMGLGPMSGKGNGYCAASRPARKRTLCGTGFGQGRGHRRMYDCTGRPAWARYGYAGSDTVQDAVDEQEMLKVQAQRLEDQLSSVKAQLEKFEQNGSDDSEQH